MSKLIIVNTLVKRILWWHLLYRLHKRTIYMYRHNKSYSIVQNNCLAIWLAS
jgi:hypothetical protein